MWDRLAEFLFHERPEQREKLNKVQQTGAAKTLAASCFVLARSLLTGFSIVKELYINPISLTPAGTWHTVPEYVSWARN